MIAHRAAVVVVVAVAVVAVAVCVSDCSCVLVAVAKKQGNGYFTINCSSHRIELGVHSLNQRCRGCS